jgi:hypothetical protein
MHSASTTTRLITLAVIAGGIACSSPAREGRPPSPPLPLTVIEQMVAAYAAAPKYEDDGVITTTSEDGSPSQVRFSTRFERGRGLEFSFWRSTPAEPDTAHDQLTVDNMGTVRKKLHSRPAEEEQGSLVDITQSLQGISRLSSIFVPRLLYGVDFCSCITAASPQFVPSDDETVYHIQLDADPATRMVLWISRDSHKLRRVDVSRSDGTARLHVSIQYRVSDG